MNSRNNRKYPSTMRFHAALSVVDRCRARGREPSASSEMAPRDADVRDGRPLPVPPPSSARRGESRAHTECPAAGSQESSARRSRPRRKLPLVARRADDSGHRGQALPWRRRRRGAKENHSRGSFASSSRLESERPKCSMSTRMPALLRFTVRTTLVAAARLPVSVQCGNSRLTEMPSGFARSQSFAKRAVARSRSGSGNWAMMCRAPSSAVAPSSATKSFGSSLGSMREELDVEHRELRCPRAAPWFPSSARSRAGRTAPRRASPASSAGPHTDSRCARPRRPAAAASATARSGARGSNRASSRWPSVPVAARCGSVRACTAPLVLT